MTPYLIFNAQCEAAFNFYAATFGGKIVTLLRHGDVPMGGPVPPESKNHILHARLAVGDAGVDRCLRPDLLGCCCGGSWGGPHPARRDPPAVTLGRLRALTRRAISSALCKSSGISFPSNIIPSGVIKSIFSNGIQTLRQKNCNCICESVPRAVASEAFAASCSRLLRSLSLAALTLRHKIHTWRKFTPPLISDLSRRLFYRRAKYFKRGCRERS